MHTKKGNIGGRNCRRINRMTGRLVHPTKRAHLKVSLLYIDPVILSVACQTNPTQGSRSCFAILHQFVGVIMLMSRPLYQQMPVQMAQVVLKMTASPTILEFFHDQGSFFCVKLAVRASSSRSCNIRQPHRDHFSHA